MDFKSLRNFSFIKNPKSWIVGGIALIGAAAMIEPKLRLEATNMGGTDTDAASLRTKEYAQSKFRSEETDNFLQKQKLNGLMKEWFDENPDDVMTRKQFAKLKRQSFGADECNHCGNVMAISPCCEKSYCPCQDFDCGCEKHYDPTGNDYPEIDTETGERYGNWEWSDDYWYQSKNAESETELIYFTAPFNIKFDTRKEANAWVRDYQMAFKYPLKVRKMSGEHYVMYGVPWEYFDAEEKSWDDYPDEFVDEVYPYDSHPNADTYDMDDVEMEYRRWENKYEKPDIREMMRNPSTTYTLWQRFTAETGITDVNTVWRIVHNPWKWEGDLLAWANDEDIHRKNAENKKLVLEDAIQDWVDNNQPKSKSAARVKARIFTYSEESDTQNIYKVREKLFGKRYVGTTIPKEGLVISVSPARKTKALARHLGGLGLIPRKVHYLNAHGYLIIPQKFFGAEDWGGDPDGPLAKALARARAKSKEPRKPLKIVKLPHKDQKSLQDFGAENDNRQLEVTDQDYFGQNMDTASDGKMRIWHHNGLPRGEGIDTEEIVDRFAFRINKGMKVPLKYYEPVADIKVPYGDVFAATQNDFYDNGWLNSDIVEEVWTDEPQARSTSVGDVIHLYDKDLWFVVAPIGFLELEPMGDFKAEYGLSAENTINYGHLHNNMAADTRRFMKPTDVIDAFKKADGSLVSITFVKRTTGEVRKMLARTGVRKGVKGVGLKFNPRNKNLIGVYDFDKVREGADPSKCYRFVPIDAVISMKVRGKTYTA